MQFSTVLALTITGLSSVLAVPMAEVVTHTTVEFVTVSSNSSHAPTAVPTFAGYNSTFAGYNSTSSYVNGTAPITNLN